MSAVLEQRKKLQQAMQAVNKKYGAGTMKPASRVAFAHLVRIPTGIFNVDVAIGGGVPKGRTTMVVGEESTGKTTFCLKVVESFQHTCRKCLKRFEWYTDEQRDPNTGEVIDAPMVVTRACECGANEPHVCAYFDIEGSFDPLWAAAHGVDIPSLLLIQPERAEEGSDMVTAMIRTGELDLVVLDSIAMMTPSREVEESAEAGRRPDQALVVNQLMRKIQAALNSLGLDNPNKPAILQVNQFRMKIGVMYGDPRTWPGGLGQNYAASILLSMRAGKAIDITGNVGGKQDAKVGVELHFKAEKNKTFTPFKKGSYHLYFADAPHLGFKKGDVNNFEQMVEYGVLLGLIEKSGAWFDLQNTFGPSFANPASGSGKFQGLDALVTFLKADPKKAEAVRDLVLTSVRSNTKVIPSGGDGDEE